MKRLLTRVWRTEPTVSESEVAFFGGALRYDFGGVRRAYARLDTIFGQAARMVPTLVDSTLHLVWRTDRRALDTHDPLHTARSGARRPSKWVGDPLWSTLRDLLGCLGVIAGGLAVTTIVTLLTSHFPDHRIRP
ncbi:hypothetical protein [Streptomyces sp. T028]|uniref:hypothetical protein n=1 Tax=Streptomyces sp. T028 TaxID=3394379 RepID=UPI003A8880C5